MKTMSAVVLAALAACSVGHAQGVAAADGMAPVPLRGMAPLLDPMAEPGPLWMGDIGRQALPIHSSVQASPWSFKPEGSEVGPRMATLAAAVAVQALSSRPGSPVGFAWSAPVQPNPSAPAGFQGPALFGGD